MCRRNAKLCGWVGQPRSAPARRQYAHRGERGKIGGGGCHAETYCAISFGSRPPRGSGSGQSRVAGTHRRMRISVAGRARSQDELQARMAVAGESEQFVQSAGRGYGNRGATRRRRNPHEVRPDLGSLLPKFRSRRSGSGGPPLPFVGTSRAQGPCSLEGFARCSAQRAVGGDAACESRAGTGISRRLSLAVARHQTFCERTPASGSGAGDGNRTHGSSLGSLGITIIRRPPPRQCIRAAHRRANPRRASRDPRALNCCMRASRCLFSITLTSLGMALLLLAGASLSILLLRLGPGVMRC